jgi:16S rRNA (guanine1207-N2)-methyltransferase
LKQIDRPPAAPVLDLGCGYGVVGIVLAKIFASHVTLADCNPRALELAEKNARTNGVQAAILLSDGYENITGTFGTIALNPPIHAGKAVLARLFDGAAAHLNTGGKFYFVMLDKHGAQNTAKEMAARFGNCETRYRKKGTNVFVCTV